MSVQKYNEIMKKLREQEIIVLNEPNSYLELIYETEKIITKSKKLFKNSKY